MKGGTGQRPVVELRGLGPASARRLADVGIAHERDLAAVGAVEAYLRVLDRHPHATSLNLLWALHGALHDLDWRDVPAAERAGLRAAVESAGTDEAD